VFFFCKDRNIVFLGLTFLARHSAEERGLSIGADNIIKEEKDNSGVKE
jgi:hypothetical protein